MPLRPPAGEELHIELIGRHSGIVQALRPVTTCRRGADAVVPEQANQGVSAPGFRPYAQPFGHEFAQVVEGLDHPPVLGVGSQPLISAAAGRAGRVRGIKTVPLPVPAWSLALS